MNTYLQTLALVLWMACTPMAVWAQDWKTETSEDGTVTVKNRIYHRTGVNGKEEQVVEYIASTSTEVSMKKLVSLVKDVSRHKEYMGQEKSLKVGTLSDHEWIVYYLYKGFWPYPSSDIVAKMVYSEDTLKKMASFSLTAAPSLYEDKGLKRLSHYQFNYQFKDLGNGKVDITLAAKFTPAVQLPVFMTSSWFPDGPANYIKGIIKLASFDK